MPGVVVTTETLTGPARGVTAPGGTYFAVGQAERGPTDESVLVRSLAEFERRFGTRVTYGALHDDLRVFFAEGGTRAYVARVVGPAATEGFLVLKDRAGVPVNTLRIEAKGAGAWSSNVTVAVANGDLANTFTLTIDGPAGTEVYPNLASPADAVLAVNARSTQVDATDLGSATAAPGNNPAVLAATALSAGTDDRAAIVAATYVAALDLFGHALGAGAVAIPGQPAGTVADGLRAHAAARSRIALLAPAAASSAAAAEGAAAAASVGADDEYVGLFWPWVRIPAGAGRTRVVPPEGFVAAKRAAAHAAAGPWRAPAGMAMGQARFVVGLETDVDAATGDDLDDARVSAIRTIAGRPTLYGWRSLSSDTDNYALLTGRDSLNVLTHEAERALEPLVFEPIDGRGHLFARAEAILVGLVEPWRIAGGVFELVDDDTGETIDRGYTVDVGAAVNTVETIAQGRIRGVLAARVSPTGTLVEVTIVKVAVDAAL